jgi:menaquinone-dependent protoporphyrinogen oxidase
VIGGDGRTRERGSYGSRRVVCTDDDGARPGDAGDMTILVAHAGKHGSTSEIAAAIADELLAAGLEVDLTDAGRVRDLDRYAGVVLGSAVYTKRWRASARRLLHRLERELGDRPLWIFSSGPVGEAEVDPGWCEPARVLHRAQRLNLRGHVIFGGRVPQDPHNFVERAMLRNTPADKQDVRDFAEIRAWARGIAAEIATREPV